MKQKVFSFNKLMLFIGFIGFGVLCVLAVIWTVDAKALLPGLTAFFSGLMCVICFGYFLNKEKTEAVIGKVLQKLLSE